jgi:DNA-binding MarR family transcriptional regulator
VNRFDVERAVRDSGLPAPAKLIMLTLATSADQTTGVVPARYAPSLTRLEKSTSLGRSTMARNLNELEASGWLRRDRPSVHDVPTMRSD